MGIITIYGAETRKYPPKQLLLLERAKFPH